MGQIVVAGSINMDVVAQTKRHPQLGETVFGQNLHFFPGGKGANQAVAAARLGGDVSLVGRIGRDAFGQSLESFLQQEKLNTDYLQYSEDAPTGTALIVVDEHSENTIVVVSGSNAQVTENDVEQVKLNAQSIVVSQFEIPQATIRHLFKQARQVGGTTILNPAPAGEAISGLFSLVDYLVLNETELAYFSQQTSTSQDRNTLIAQARKLATNATVIITLGAMGLICINHDQIIDIPGIPVNAVDTTGAGDCFVGAFAMACAEGKMLEDALDFANRAASLSVQRLGASSSMPFRQELENNP